MSLKSEEEQKREEGDGGDGGDGAGRSASSRRGGIIQRFDHPKIIL